MISQRELEIADGHSLLGRPVYTEEWSWASQRAPNPFPVPIAPVVNPIEDTSTHHPISSTLILPSPDESTTVQNVLTTFNVLAAGVQGSLNDIDEGIYSTSLSNQIHGIIAAIPVLGPQIPNPMSSTQTPTHTSVQTRSDEETLLMTVSPPNTDLMAAMVKVGIPFPDYALLDSPPMAHTAAQRTLCGAVGVGALLGRKLLGCMYEMLKVTVQIENQLESNSNLHSNSNLPILSSLSSASATTHPSQVLEIRQPLLLFNEISEAERTLFLEEFLVSNGAKPFSEEEINRIKCLPLFTVRPKLSGAISSPLSLPLPFFASSSSSSSPSPSLPHPISISDCTAGAYWCDNNSIMDGIVYPSPTQGPGYLSISLLVYRYY